MKAIYHLFGADDNIEGKFFPFPHNYNQHSREMMYDFFNMHLKLGWPSPVKEMPFVPVPPEQLSVYDAAHPLPNDAVDADGVRKYWTESSDRQINALAERPEEYAQMLRTALQAMVIDSMPASGQVELIDASAPQPPMGGGEWRGFISRKSAGERVPFKAIFPANWDGRVVLWVHPEGCASIAPDDAGIKSILGSSAAVLAIEPFMSGTFLTTKKAITKPP